MTVQPSGSGIFTRRSSGLVREAGVADTLYYAFAQVAVPYVIFVIAFWAFYPGASMEIATAITVVGAIALGLVYALFSSVYPRSGGEYVFLSRTVHPAVGFVVSFAVAFWQAFYLGVNGAFLAIYGLAPFLAALGLQTGSQLFTDLAGWVQEPLGIFVVGAIAVLSFGWILSRGVRAYFTFQRWAAIIGLASLAVAVIILLLGATGALNFRSSFDGLLGSGAYQKVIDDGQPLVDLTPAVQIGPTLEFIVWPAFSLLFAVLSVSFSGEIKNVRRGQLYGISGGVLLGGAALILLMALARAAIGDEFLRASAALFFTPDSPGFPLANPWLNLVASIMGGNVIATVVVNLGFFVFILMLAGVTIVYSSRAILAWSLDGMAPAKLGEVSESHHAPVPAIVLAVVVGLVTLAIYAFTDWITILSGLAGFAVAFLIMSVAGIVFPYSKRETFERSPAAISAGGVPLISVAGVVATAFLAFVIYRLFIDATLGANTPFSLWANVAVYVVGFAWFVAARAYQKSRGVDVDSAFREIPVE